MRSKQRIHEIQDTATSFEENFETLAFEPICVGNINQEIKAHKDEVFPTVNVNIAGRGKREPKETCNPSASIATCTPKISMPTANQGQEH